MSIYLYLSICVYLYLFLSLYFHLHLTKSIFFLSTSNYICLHQSTSILIYSYASISIYVYLSAFIICIYIKLSCIFIYNNPYLSVLFPSIYMHLYNNQCCNLFVYLHIFLTTQLYTILHIVECA